MARDVAHELAGIVTRTLKLDPGTVAEDTPFFEGGLELDSFAVVELVTALEGHFGIQITDNDFAPESFRSIQTLAGVIEKYLPAEAG